MSENESEKDSESESQIQRQSHKALRLPRNVHVEVHKVLRLLRNLRFEVHKALRLPRYLRFKVHKVLHTCAPATKSALRGSQSAAPATKSALQGPQSTAPATKSALQSPLSTAPATKSALRGPQSILRLLRFLKTNRMYKSHDSACLSRNERARKITTISKALRLPRSLHLEAQPLRSLPLVTKYKSTLDRQNTRFPLRPPRKVTTMPENARGPQRERPPRPARFCEPAQSKSISRSSRGVNALQIATKYP